MSNSNQKMGIGLYTVDQDYNILFVNQAVRDMFPGIQVGKPCYQEVAMKDHPCEVCPMQSGSMLLFNPDRGMWSAATCAELEIPGHGLCRNIQFEIRNQDISERVSLVAESEISGHISDVTGDITGAAIGSYCKLGSPIFYANDQMVALMGYDSLDEMMAACNGMAANLIHPEDRQRVRDDLRGINQPGMMFETAYRSPLKNGDWVWLVIRGKVAEMPDGRLATISICSDMSDFLKRHEMLRSANEDLLRKEFLSEAIQENMPSGYHRCAMDDKFTFLYFGKSFEDVIGWTREEIENRFHNSFAELIHPDDANLCTGIIYDIAERGRGSAIYRFVQKDGKDRWFSDSTMRVDLGSESFYQGTLTDVTDYVESIRRQTAELEIAKAQAEASNQAKSTFLFSLSHDIRTPMNAIKGFSQIIQENPGDEALVRDNITKISKSSDILMKLLNDVLEISRIESGKEQPEMAPVDLESVCERMRLMFAKDMDDAGIDFVMENQLKHRRVWCDELKCIQIGMNMLSNAKKFTPAGQQVVFGIRELSSDYMGASAYRFYVRDTGIGMSPEFLSRAFEQFEREQTSTNSGQPGTGLGLSIIKRLTELMGGHCTLTSQLGEGTEIASVLILDWADGDGETVAQAAFDPAILVGKRVLLTEDNDFNREIAHYILDELGMQVTDAVDGQAAVDMLMKAGPGAYDLVLMDIQMPVMDGYVATRAIRNCQVPEIASIPIVAMTANAFREDQERCRQVGMNAHIGKPLEARIIAQTLVRVLEGR